MFVYWDTLEDARNTDDKGELLGIALNSWGNCMAGNKPPEYFGIMMTEIGYKLGIIATPDNVMKLAKELYPQEPQS